jgi:hypothetical protein
LFLHPAKVTAKISSQNNRRFIGNQFLSGVSGSSPFFSAIFIYSPQQRNDDMHLPFTESFSQPQ